MTSPITATSEEYKMRVAVLLTTLVIAVVTAEGVRYGSYRQENDYYNSQAQEQAYMEEAEMSDVCTSITLSGADRRLADALQGARRLPNLPLQPTRGIQPKACEDGPKKILHSVQNEFHIPQIYKGACNILPCADDRCRTKKSLSKTKCVLVFRFQSGQWTNIGYRNIPYIDHTECECKKCKHITTHEECVETTACPNGDNDRSYCYWESFFIPSEVGSPIEVPGGRDVAELEKEIVDVTYPEGRCDCCSPLPCKLPFVFNRAQCRCVCQPIRCPPNQVFNRRACRCECSPIICRPPKILNTFSCKCQCPRIRCPPPLVPNEDTCECDCPLGSTKGSDGKCVGDCREVGPGFCTQIHCRDNPSLTCKLNGTFSRDCICPSCVDATAETCSQTRCLEQPSKPQCVINKETKRCDCPTCYHQNEPRACRVTHCGKSPSLQCKYSEAYGKCYCPYEACLGK